MRQFFINFSGLKECLECTTGYYTWRKRYDIVLTDGLPGRHLVLGAGWDGLRPVSIPRG